MSNRPHTPESQGKYDALRQMLAERDGLLCHWCGCQLTVDRNDLDGRNGPCLLPGVLFGTVEHLKPRMLGGTDDPANLRLACSPCNRRRPLIWRNTLLADTPGCFTNYTTYEVSVFPDSPPKAVEHMQRMMVCNRPRPPHWRTVANAARKLEIEPEAVKVALKKQEQSLQPKIKTQKEQIKLANNFLVKSGLKARGWKVSKKFLSWPDHDQLANP